MEQKKKGLWQWFNSLRLSHKIMAAVGLLIFCSNLTILLLVSQEAYTSLRQKSCEQLQGQLTIALSTVSSSIEDIEELMVNLTTTSDIKEYVNQKYSDTGNHLELINNANESMRFLKRANNMIDYVALLRMDNSQMLYTGTIIPQYDIQNLFIENYQQSTYVVNDRVTANLLTGCYSDAELNLFCPIYESYTLKADSPNAVLVVGINTKKIIEYVAADQDSLNLRILTSEGIIVASEQANEIGEEAAWFSSYTDTKGELSAEEEQLIAYQRSEDGLWMADGVISQRVLFASIHRTTAFIAVVILLCTLFAILLSAGMCNLFYRPMQNILYNMHLVSEGNLDTTIELYPDQDFRQLSQGFNEMTTALRGLIASIQRREQENTEIRLNALQSQIKPHFLYNTLECIHWQALMEGAPEASKMVIELSRYYRLCLSKGADIVPLEQEIEHTRSYISIQNMRFDGIFHVTWDIPEELNQLEIPKITLQPLVENAIYHGIKPLDREGNIHVSARRDGEWLTLTVADDGCGMTELELKSLNQTIDQLINDGSYGVKNVHKRLSIRYGEGSGLFYQKNESGGITVTVHLPAKPILG
jgi:two-component system sensor histidine kinase YesM